MDIKTYNLYRFEINRVSILLESAESPSESDFLGVDLAHLVATVHLETELAQAVLEQDKDAAKMAEDANVADSQI